MLLLSLACYTAPLIQDSASYPSQAALSGELVLVQGTPTGGPGVGHVLLYDLNDPPPPAGFGSPATFSTVSRDAWSYATYADVDGVASAAWSMTNVPPGDYLITALVDNDGDFNPFPGISDYAGGATCGDQTGAYVASATASGPLPVRLETAQNIEELSLLVGSPLTTERPAYVMGTENPSFDPLIAPDPADLAGTLQTLTLRSTGIESPLLRLNPPTAQDCPTLFTVIKKDLDGDGVADPFSDPQVAALGGLDMWPLVVLSYLRDLDGNPVEDQVITQVLVSPFGLPDALAVNTPYATDTLPLMFLPVAQRTNADGSVDLLSGDDFPRGEYAMVVINHTGQLWTTPNNLAELLPEQGATVVIR
jgi:hypothetical protein